MRDIQVREKDVEYVCGGRGCTAKDGKHQIEKEEILGSLLTLLEECMVKGDIRSEALELATRILWTLFYPNGDVTALVDQDSTLRRSFDEVKRKVRVVSFTQHMSKNQATPKVWN